MFARSESPSPCSRFASRRAASCTPRDALRSLLALALAGGLLAGCGGSTQEADPSGAGEMARTDESGGLEPAMSRKLEEKEVQSYMVAVEELQKLGALTNQKLGDDPSQLSKMAAAFSFPAKWESVLKKHGLDTESYAEVHVAVIGALGALMSEEVKVQFEEQKKERAEQIEQMKKVLSPEQVAEMEKGMAEAEAEISAMYDSVPKENIELVRKYKDQLEAAFKK